MPDILKIKNEQGQWISFPAFTGPPPDIGIGEVVAGATPSDAAASFSGTREAPLLNLTLPKGETGAAGVAVASAAPSLGELVWIDTGNSVNSKTLPEIDDSHVSNNDTWSSNKINNLTLASRICDLIYPVGSIYMSVNSTSPATIFGGTWVQIEDTFLLAAGSTYTAGSTGGEATHTLVNNELPKISGSFTNRKWGASGDGIVDASGIVSYVNVTQSANCYATGSSNPNVGQKVTISFGNDQAHNNMPPYLVIYVWKRTA